MRETDETAKPVHESGLYRARHCARVMIISRITTVGARLLYQVIQQRSLPNHSVILAMRARTDWAAEERNGRRESSCVCNLACTWPPCQFSFFTVLAFVNARPYPGSWYLYFLGNSARLRHLSHWSAAELQSSPHSRTLRYAGLGRILGAGCLHGGTPTTV